MTQKNPFLYKLEMVGKDQQYLLFRRYRKDEPRGNVWGMHMDIEDPKVERVLIFVHEGTPADEIMDEINKAQSYFCRQVES